MLSTMRRELKDNIGDRLRGINHLVRALGSDTPEIRVANQALPPLPPELNRLLGATFQTVHGVMGTLKTIATPFRHCRSSTSGFGRFEDYFGSGRAHADSYDALADDVYKALKLVARSQDPNSFILKTRIAELCRKLVAAARIGKWTDGDLDECCSTFFLLLVQAKPLPETDVEQWKTYAAVSLAFGLSLSCRLPADEFAAFAQGDAILVSTQRANVFLEAIRTDTRTEALLKTFESLLRHLP